MVWLEIAAILALWACCTVVLTGVGVVTASAAGFHVASPRFSLFWLGWSITIALLQIASLVVRIDGSVQAAIGLLGLAGVVILLSRGWRPRVSFRGACAAIALTIFAAYVARHGLVEPRSYDTGTYHLPAVMWLNAFPIVKGLGNLHVRLAVNNSVFLYDALLNAGPLNGFTINLSIGLLFVAIAAELFARASRDLDRPVAGAVWLLAIPFVFAPTYTVAAEGLSPDLALYACGLELAIILLCSSTVGTRTDDDRALDAFSALLIASIACTVKPSFVAFSAGVFLWYRLAWPRLLSWRRQLTVALVSLVAIATWIGRNILLSGYPLFPSPVLPLNVPWRIPLETAREDYDAIRALARVLTNYDMNVSFARLLGGWDWLPHWAATAAGDLWGLTVPLLLAAGGVTAIALSPTQRRQVTMRQLGLVLIPVCATLFWFLSAPDPRFAGSVFVVAALFVAAIVLATIEPDALKRRAALVIYAVAVVLILKQVDNMYFWMEHWPSRVSFGVLTKPDVLSMTTRNGLKLYVPAVAETCWAAPLPCTPYPSQDLALRDPAALSSGFMVKPFSDDALTGWWNAEHRWESMKPKN